jgi:hypothetical protein
VNQSRFGVDYLTWILVMIVVDEGKMVYDVILSLVM